MIVVPRLWFPSLDSSPSGVSESILRKDPRQSEKPTQNLSLSRASKRVAKGPTLSNDCVRPVAAGTNCLQLLSAVASTHAVWRTFGGFYQHDLAQEKATLL